MTAGDTAPGDGLARRLRGALVDELTAGGYLSASWRRFFEQVPRHHFMPQLFVSRDDGRYVPLDEHIDKNEWLRHVYTNQLCVTQLDGDDDAWEAAVTRGAVEGIQTCTSTEPGLMAWMLEDLDLHAGNDVLEVGTGTGYNAALLAQRVGGHHVVSVDVDPALVQQARDRLADLGIHPTLVVADGRDGYATGAPYDRIIATCSLPYLPSQWVNQTRPGGRIILNLGGLLGGAMLRVEVHADGTAEGRFLTRWAGFLPARPHPPGVAEITPRDTNAGAYDVGATDVSPDVLDNPAFAFLAWLATQDARPYWAASDEGERLACLIGVDGSWAEVYPPDASGVHYVEQGGPRRLWTLVEEAHRFWGTHDRPDWSRFGVTAAPRCQYAWFGDPDGPRWTIPIP